MKPNNLPKEVPREKTIAQIATSLNEVGKYASDFGLLVRVEVHGTLTQEIPNIRAIFEQVKALAIPGTEMTCLSMGMSDSFRVAVEEGATLVRVGTKIFGGRTKD